MLVLPSTEVQVLDMGVEEGIQMIISGGAVTGGAHIEGIERLSRGIAGSPGPQKGGDRS